MKTLIRWYARSVTDFAKKFACETNGDVADLSAGPCGRCVGRALAPGPQATGWYPGDPTLPVFNRGPLPLDPYSGGYPTGSGAQ